MPYVCQLHVQDLYNILINPKRRHAPVRGQLQYQLQFPQLSVRLREHIQPTLFYDLIVHFLNILLPTTK